MSIENEALARHTLEEMFDRGHPGYLVDVSDLSFIGHDPTITRSLSLADEKQVAVNFRHGFPDLRCEVSDCFTDGERVMCRWRMHGTHRGTFLGFAPTGRAVRFEGVTEMKFHGTRLAEQWTFYDCFGLLHQMGVVPSLSALAERQVLERDESDETGEQMRSV